MDIEELKILLENRSLRYENLQFIENDPVSIPHRYNRKEDIEIMAFWTAILSWGQRVTIINKALELDAIMEGQPYAFISNPSASGLKKLKQFKHRTFNGEDALYFVAFFHWFYQHHHSLEEGFLNSNGKLVSMKQGISDFHNLFTSLPTFPARTRKHIATPVRNSGCKRINMFLRWMVRDSKMGVDFGLWHKIKPSQLMMPLDVHVMRVARQLGMLKREKQDWKAVEELTQMCRLLDVEDPVKYDFALFGMGVMGEK